MNMRFNLSEFEVQLRNDILVNLKYDIDISEVKVKP